MVLQVIVLFFSISVSHLMFMSRIPLYLSLLLLNIYIQYDQISKHSTPASIIGAFLPGCFLNHLFSNSIEYLLSSQLLLAVLLYAKLSITIQVLIISLILSIIFFIVLQTDFNNMQQIYSYYRKSDLLFQNIWTKSPCLNFILDKSGQILHLNQAAEDLASNKVIKTHTEKPLKFTSLMEIENFPEFLEKVFKDEQVEEEVFRQSYLDKLGSLMDDGLAFLVRAEKVMWGGVKCASIYSTDISLFRARRMMLIESLRMVQINTEKFMKQVVESIKGKEGMDNETFVAFYNVNQLLRDTLVLKSRFFCMYEPRFEHFDVNSEIINTIEILYLKACRNNVAIVYTKEQGIPSSLIGDKVLHFQIIYTLINLILENSIAGSEVQVFLQVYSLMKYDITLNYKFAFKSDKITNVNVESMFLSQNYHCSKDVILQSSEQLNKFGLGVTASNSILLFLRGNIVKVHSESDMSKVTINLTLPFNTGKRVVNHPKIRISENLVQETNLTNRWKPVLHKSVKRLNGIKENSISFEAETGFELSFVNLDPIFIDNCVKEEIKEILNVEELIASDILNSKVFVLVITQLQSLSSIFPSNFVLVKCKNSAEAKNVFLSYCKYKAKFNAILLDQLNKETYDLSRLVREMEKESYLKTAIYYLRSLYIE